MSVCPKCNKKIGLLYLKQNCPHCNVNLRFYNFEENFYRDAKKAELSLAGINIFFARMKGSFLGSGLAKVRLVVMLLPLLSFLLPYGTVHLSQPFFSSELSLSALGVYSAYEDGLLPYIITMMSAEVNGKAFFMLAVVLFLYLLAALCALLIFFMTLLCFLSISKMHKVLIGTAVTGSVFSVLSTVAAAVLAASDNGSLFVSGKATPAVVASLICFGAVAAINVKIGKKGLNIIYKEGDLERAEIAAKVKSGLISLDDLPQPVVATAETEKIRLEIEKQQKLYLKLEEEDSNA